MKRAQKIKQQWVQFRAEQDTTGKSWMNFGRTRLGWYLEHCYTMYQELCYATGAEPIKIGKWLIEEI